MKPFRILPIFLLLTVFSISCHKDNNHPGFEMLYQQEFIIPAGIGSNVVHHFYFINLSTRYLQYLDQFSKTDADITQVVTSKSVLSGVFGDANYDFIDEVKLTLYDENDPNDKIEIAYRYPTPLTPGNTLPLIPNLPDIKRFMSKSRFSIDLALRLRNITQEETQTRLDLQFIAETRE